MEYHNFQEKRGLSGVEYGRSTGPLHSVQSVAPNVSPNPTPSSRLPEQVDPKPVPAAAVAESKPKASVSSPTKPDGGNDSDDDEVHVDILHENFDVVRSATDDVSRDPKSLLAAHRHELHEYDLPYGHIPSRADQRLSDETELQDTYTTTGALLLMAGVSAAVLATMIATKTSS
jgi:hypothetical protein